MILQERKKKSWGITCPIKKGSPKIDRNKMQQMQNAPIWKQNPLLEVEFLGFKKNTKNYFISQNPYGVEILINQDEFRSLYYEMKIPFKKIYSDYSDISLKSLSIGLETGALNMPSQGNRPEGMNSRPTGGGKGGGGGRGGRHGEMSGGGNTNAIYLSLTHLNKLTISSICLLFSVSLYEILTKKNNYEK